MKKTILIFLVIVLMYFSYFYKNNYTSTIEEAANKANIQYDEIYQTSKVKNRILILYDTDENEVFSVGLLKKNWLGYKWIMGSGSGQVSGINVPVSLAIANLPVEHHGEVSSFVSIAFGSVNLNEIEKLNVQFKDTKIKSATIIDTKRGRKWFSISDNPVNGDPQVIGINKKGKEVYRNY
ncbi:hypothetical protein [Paenibacillus motobuensis]|uniref:Uncharacterized protein n=1 Tax=Paenibacillus motobuensis TaxID=295324 RepID=A0ABN0Y6K2_9BACL